ncbi:DNA repair and recombination protein RAD54 [Rhynchospora pubera]|uniref:ATP-dependent helicase ATRX n=1 Tax=Rhynchospora pubera TaxID=906938 RepID=A0AAV8EH82_9POAL|nr:DNA repair and recombination protein RAD54 [Rhynchospora pubera]
MENNELPKEDALVQFSEERNTAINGSYNTSDDIIENFDTPVEQHGGLVTNYNVKKDDPVNVQPEEVKDSVDVEIEINGTKDGIVQSETVHEEEEEGSDSLEMFLDDSGSEQSNNADDESIAEVPLTDAEVEEILAEFIEVESKAAEAQESLEKEALAQVEKEVRFELSQSLNRDELDLAVTKEMEAFTLQWEAELDELETRSSVLLEQLDGAGIDLPSLYKWIESQIPDGCRTEAWKKRAHWVGSRASGEVDESVKTAEEFLQSCRPVRRKHGRLLEEGASGFLAGKLPISSDKPSHDCEASWNSFNQLIKSNKCSDNGFGSSNWASVYLASTPQQAASLGLKFPGVDEVEEIADIEADDADFKNLNELELSEEQKRKYRKVREEDDENRIKRMQRHLKQERTRKKRLQPTLISDSTNGYYDTTPDDTRLENGDADDTNSLKEHSTSKRAREEYESELDNKKHKAEMTDSSDDEVKVLGSKLNSPVKKAIDVIDLDTPFFTERSQSRSFSCTVCSEALKKSSEVHRHPLLAVIVCASCKFTLAEKIRLEGADRSGYCKWCCKSEELVSCGSCTMQFCKSCIGRNLGEECLSDATTATTWQCCCCLPSLLENSISQYEKALVSTPEPSISESGSDHSEAENGVVNRKRRRKKRIRRIIDDAELAEETKSSMAQEKARQEHLKSMQESANKWSSMISSTSPAAASVVMEDLKEGYIINIAREVDEVAVRIPNSISVKLKPHQLSGIRFMWENVIQSVKKVKSGDKGLGCILAHTMGLGKTFQVIAFLYTVMRSIDLGLRRALIVTPVNVLHNWKNEFAKWQPTEVKPLRVFLLEQIPNVKKRLYILSKWRAKGGVFLIGYVQFRKLLLGKSVRDRDIAIQIFDILQNGADILVCDEAHLIKNRMAETTQALKQVKTKRRIALTGSPLQNNLMEYYCMVDFVREGYLGSSHEFRNRFQNPIENGQHANSTADDVKVMNQRSHILYEQLKGFVQRMDMNVVKKDLPPKTVFVITVKLSQLQRRLYRKFLDVHGYAGSSSSDRRAACFFAGYTTLAQIWNHPGLLKMPKENKSSKRDGENFLDDDSSSDDNLEKYLFAGEKQKMKISNDLPETEEKWWENLLDEKTFQEPDFSGKMVLLLDILSMSSGLGEKSLIFSQSLPTLDLIEYYLSRIPRKGSEGKFWKQGKDWFRIDGTTLASERQNLVEKFNDPLNRRVKCVLISTRAGSLGINLHAANRVILVDGSWNPTYDLQAIYRVWRYGQKRPVYAYRLLAHGTMEEKIYKRQVTKEGLAARVVDKQQIFRTMSKEEMLHLFDFGDEELLEQSKHLIASSSHDIAGQAGPLKQNKSIATHGSGSSDGIMLNLLNRHQPCWIVNYHEHETLLQENEAEKLTKEEQEMAWLNYQRSLEWEEVHRTAVYEDYNTERKQTTTSSTSAATVAANNNSNSLLGPESNSHAAPQVKSSRLSNSQPHQPKTGLANTSNPKNRVATQRKCSNLAHLLMLRSCATKAGCSTTCTDCGQEISWETLNRDGRTR